MRGHHIKNDSQNNKTNSLKSKENESKRSGKCCSRENFVKGLAKRKTLAMWIVQYGQMQKFMRTGKLEISKFMIFGKA